MDLDQRVTFWRWHSDRDYFGWETLVEVLMNLRNCNFFRRRTPSSGIFFLNLLKVGNSYRKKTLPRIYHSFHRRISAKVNNLLLQPKPAKIQKTKPDKLINQFHYCVCAFVLSPAGLPVQSNLASPLRERRFHSLSANERTKIYKKHRKHSGNRYLEWLAREPGPKHRKRRERL